MQAFSPREIVSELDRFIIGQDDAKKAVAIALRNRWRRQQLLATPSVSKSDSNCFFSIILTNYKTI